MSYRLDDTINDMYACVGVNYAFAKGDDEMLEYRLLKNVLMNMDYLSDACSNDFNVDCAPNEVYIFDCSRLMFWKPFKRGYTPYIVEAGLFYLEDALKICEIEKDNKIVYFDFD